MPVRSEPSRGGLRRSGRRTIKVQSMRNVFSRLLLSGLLALGAAPAAAQPATVPPAVLKLTVDAAVKMALRDNLDLAADRLEPEIGDTQIAAASASFRPSVNSALQRNNQLQPPASFLIPTATRNDVMNSNVGVSQLLPWFGTAYGLSWNSSHTNSNSFLNSYNPLLQSGLSLNVSQPLLRDLAIDAPRLQLATSRIGRDAAGTRLRESEVRTAAAVKSAYWNLVSARANVDARRTALQLAEELARVNKAKVDVGQSPPLDLVSAEAEVASAQEQLIIGETAVKQAEDQLRVLIFDATAREVWTVAIETVDSPPVGTVALDVDTAITAALRDRADLERARLAVKTADTTTRYTGNQRLPDVRVNASYQSNGLGGTEIVRTTGGFPGTIVGAGNVTSFGSVLDQLFRSDFPTWTFGVSVSYPLGQSAQEANYARSTLERGQAQTRVKSAEAHVIQQIRDAAWKVEMNAKRIETTRAANGLAEQRLDAEQKRFEVGMSTSFLVIQAQRDLVQAKTNELSAVLAYDLSLVDYEALQQAGPAGQASTAGYGSTTAGGQVTSSTATATSSSRQGTSSTSLPSVAAPTATTVPGFN
jgi:outer membrane protein TolC